jgi:hypothetical protein
MNPVKALLSLNSNGIKSTAGLDAVVCVKSPLLLLHYTVVNDRKWYDWSSKSMQFDRRTKP